MISKAVGATWLLSVNREQIYSKPIGKGYTQKKKKVVGWMATIHPPTHTAKSIAYRTLGYAWPFPSIDHRDLRRIIWQYQVSIRDLAQPHLKYIHTCIYTYIYILIKWWIVTNQCTLLFPYPRMSHGAHGTYLSQNMWLFLHNLLLDHCKRNISRWEVQIESVHVYMHKA